LQQGIINITISKTQWGAIKHKKDNRPQIFGKLLRSPTLNKSPLSASSTPKSPTLKSPSLGRSSLGRSSLGRSSSKDVFQHPKALTKSKSISSLFLTSKDEKAREGSIQEQESDNNDNEPMHTKFRTRGRSNSDLRPTLYPGIPPTSTGLLQGIANLVDLSEPEDVVRNIIRDGIPANYRAELWLAMSGITQKLPMVKGVYQSLIETLDKPPFLDSLAYEQIEKDIGRTFPGIDFTPSGYEFQPTLRRILRAYAVRNPVLGYCQSMNFIAGGLLIFMEEEHAFWMLSWIVEELLNGYFTKTMVGLQVDTALFEKFLKKHLPELSKHLNALGFSNIFCTVQWFLCMYLNNLPSEAAFRVWDLVFYSGTKVLFEVGLNIMKVFEPQILRKQDSVDIASSLSKHLTSMFDISPFLSQNFLKNVTAEEIKAMQKKLHREVQTELRGRHDTLQMIELLRLTKFSKAELTDLYAQFTSLDPMLNEFGINIYVFKNMLPVAFPNWKNLDEYFCQKLFDSLDADNDSLVDFKDLMLCLSAIYRGTVKEKLTVCSRLFGGNAGRVYRADVHKLLFSIYKLVEQSNEKVILREVNFFTDMFF